MSLLLNYATFIHDPTFYRHGNHINFANFLSAFYSLHAYTLLSCLVGGLALCQNVGIENAFLLITQI